MTIAKQPGRKRPIHNITVGQLIEILQSADASQEVLLAMEYAGNQRHFVDGVVISDGPGRNYVVIHPSDKCVEPDGKISGGKRTLAP